LLHIKIEGRKVKNIDLAQENGFALAYLQSLLRLVKGATKLCTC
jgi:hypothetical protein